jgi:hypothetical protein
MDTPQDIDPEIRAAASAFGRLGGRVKSDKKAAAVRQNLAKARASKGEKAAAAARENGKKGGRPRKVRPESPGPQT